MVLYRPGDAMLYPGHRSEGRAVVTEPLTLGALFAASFLAATLLPGGSEVVLVGLLLHDASLFWPALAVATLGNTLGGMSSYALGRVLPRPALRRRFQLALDWLKRHGTPALLLSWVPLVGDGLCVAAGWLRLQVLPVLLFMAVGKFARYWILASLAK